MTATERDAAREEFLRRQLEQSRVTAGRAARKLLAAAGARGRTRRGDRALSDIANAAAMAAGELRFAIRALEIATRNRRGAARAA